MGLGMEQVIKVKCDCQYVSFTVVSTFSSKCFHKEVSTYKVNTVYFWLNSVISAAFKYTTSLVAAHCRIVYVFNFTNVSL